MSQTKISILSLSLFLVDFCTQKLDSYRRHDNVLAQKKCFFVLIR